jgi:hypothetical protein
MRKIKWKSAQFPGLGVAAFVTGFLLAPHGAKAASEAACYSDAFQQPKAQSVDKVDYLLVIDTSGSMNDERGRIAENIGSFVDRLPDGVDLRIAVMPAHGTSSKYSGAFLKAKNEPYVLSSRSLSKNDLRKHLISKMKKVVNDLAPAYGEMPLISLWNGLEGSKFEVSKSRGFFRDDAALAVTLISDENDVCYKEETLDRKPPLTQKEEERARQMWCRVRVDGAVRDFSTDLLRERIAAIKGKNPVALSAIGYEDLKRIPVGRNRYDGVFAGAIQLIRESEGRMYELADRDFSHAMDNFGFFVSSQLEAKTEFPLSHPNNVLASSIVVRVDEVVTPHQYSEQRNLVTPSSSGTWGSSIRIDYCEKGSVIPGGGEPPVEVTPTPTPVVIAPTPTPVVVVPSPTPVAPPEVIGDPIVILPVPTPVPPIVVVVPSPTPVAPPEVIGDPIVILPAPSPSPSPASGTVGCQGIFCNVFGV